MLINLAHNTSSPARPVRFTSPAVNAVEDEDEETVSPPPLPAPAFPDFDEQIADDEELTCIGGPVQQDEVFGDLLGATTTQAFDEYEVHPVSGNSLVSNCATTRERVEARKVDSIEDNENTAVGSCPPAPDSDDEELSTPRPAGKCPDSAPDTALKPAQKTKRKVTKTSAWEESG